MNTLSGVLWSLTSLLLSLNPFQCAGQVRTVDPPTGREWILQWGKAADNGAIVEIDIPPGYPGGSAQACGETYQLPANPGQQVMKWKVTCKDPVVVQIPDNWSILSTSITTGLGTAPMTVVSGPIPSGALIDPLGSVIPVAHYTPEPGFQLVLLDVPPALVTPGWLEASIEFHGPAPATGHLDVKVISTVTVELTPLGTSATTRYYPPLDPVVIDFALVTESLHRIRLDFESTVCTSPSGMAPVTELPTHDLALGGSLDLRASGLNPTAPTFFIAGLEDAHPTLPFGSGIPGCKLRVSFFDGAFAYLAFPATVDPSGNASTSLPIPMDLALEDFTSSWQVLAIDPLSPNGILLGNHIKTKVER